MKIYLILGSMFGILYNIYITDGLAIDVFPDMDDDIQVDPFVQVLYRDDLDSHDPGYTAIERRTISKRHFPSKKICCAMAINRCQGVKGVRSHAEVHYCIKTMEGLLCGSVGLCKKFLF
ncbi:unnamed protein product [Owenia fusiformis]|uniref:Uncharacterized protein n=1 Tax=Owenia fusiformis TaxID=6347 RepID=A0A8J1TDG3_OWEFU|nr:unnamed protein product [Owenia fusiformis]